MSGELKHQDASSESPDWQPCQGGEIRSLVRRLISRKSAAKRRRVLQVTSVAACLLVVVGISWSFLQPAAVPTQAQRVRKPACAEVFAQGERYLRHELSAEQQARIQAHLEACPPCHAHVRKLEGKAHQARKFIRSSMYFLSDNRRIEVRSARL